MQDFDLLTQATSGNTQFFGPGTQFCNLTRNCKLVYLVGYSSGAGGGGGLTGATSTGRGGGSGGGGSGLTSMMIPRALLPDGFVVKVSPGGNGGVAGGAGSAGVATQALFDMGGTQFTFFITGNAPTGGLAGSATVAQAGSAGGTVPAASSFVAGQLGVWMTLPGTAGSSSGAPTTAVTGGTNITPLAANTPFTGGCGGGAANTTNGAGLGGSINAVGPIPSTATGRGAAGFLIRQPLCAVGGNGGDGSAAGTGGTGGLGGPGCGGGGGGGGITGGPGGQGGPGGLYVICF